MKIIEKISQTRLSLFIAAYIGIFLNSPTYYRRIGIDIDASIAFTLLRTAIEVCSIFCITFILLTLLSLTEKWVYRIVASFMVIISAAASYYILFYNVLIGYGIIVSVLAINDDLSKESVGYIFVLWMLTLVIIPLYMIWKPKLENTFYTLIKDKHKRKRWISLCLFIILFAGLPFWGMNKYQRAENIKQERTMASYGGVIAHSYLPLNWIAALGLYGYVQASENLGERQVLFDPAKNFTYVAPEKIDETYVIFIIGESARWDHVGMLGYERPTSPLLEKEPNLVAFKGTSCDTATKLSLRCMFVRENGSSDNQQRTLKEENVFHVLKSLGFSSELYAMQAELWFYNRLNLDQFALKEMIASQKGNEGKPIDDMLLIPPLQDSLRRNPQGKHVIILHTKGSHYLYSQRYPRNFAIYQPECNGIDSFCDKQSLINSFDNSTLYTDYFLKQVIDQVRDKNAIVFYASDHGESIDENMHFHATPRAVAPPEQFNIPIYVWASDKFLATPERKRNFDILKDPVLQAKPHRQEDLFDSILGCLGYTSSNGGINAKNNWCAQK